MFEIIKYTLATTYLLTALIFATMTYAESWLKADGWTLYRIFGISLSIVWPLLIAIVAVLALQEHKNAERQKTLPKISEPIIMAMIILPLVATNSSDIIYIM